MVAIIVNKDHENQSKFFCLAWIYKMHSVMFYTMLLKNDYGSGKISVVDWNLFISRKEMTITNVKRLFGME